MSSSKNSYHASLKLEADRWITGLQERLNQLKPLPLNDLPPERTVLILIDMVQGFAHEGPLASPRVGALIPEISALAEACLLRGIPVIAPSDTHSETAGEFDAYPPHCLAGTAQSALVPEISGLEGVVTLAKNSTQAWHSKDFQAWFSNNTERTHWVLVGDCTDICVLQFALALKTFFQSENQSVRVIVPLNGVDTFETPDHPGDLYHFIGLDLMARGGVELVSQMTL